MSMVQTDYSEFTTEDLRLAAYLASKGVRIKQLIPLDEFRCAFVLDNPSPEYLEAWLRGDPQSNAVQVINEYRHLTRDSRQVCRGVR